MGIMIYESFTAVGEGTLPSLERFSKTSPMAMRLSKTVCRIPRPSKKRYFGCDGRKNAVKVVLCRTKDGTNL